MQRDNHEFIDGLLPWFVNNTLAPDERGRVLRHLDGCETCRANVSLFSVVEATMQHATATPMVPPPHADRLLEAIDGIAKKRPHRWPLTIGLLAASLAAALLVVTLLLPDDRNTATPPASYETATSTAREASMDYVIDLRFEPGTALPVRERVLRDLEASDIHQGETSSTYRMTVNLPAASLGELQRYMRDLESSSEIESVNVVALQLPVEEK
jgi:anti-sigma factor RsiW